MIRNHTCQALGRYITSLSLMKTTFYNNAPMQMQMYVDCLFRLVLLYINLYIHPALFFALEEIMWLFLSSVCGFMVWHAHKDDKRCVSWEQPSAALAALC